MSKLPMGTITLLFTDIEGSTQLLEQLGERYQQVLGECRQLSAEGYVGLDVHRATRIMSAGHGGQVLLSQTTRDLVEHDLPEGIGLRDLGAHRLKDLQQKSHLFQLVIAGLPADFPSLKTLDTRPNNLPIQPTPFLGREQVLMRAQGLLRREEVRLLTLTGPGGIGKTRLGLQVAADLADRFADGVFFVNLTSLSDPALVLPTIVSTLDLKESAGQVLLDVLIAYLRNKELLLLLDNFEQVLSAAGQVADLLSACPKLKVLVTSRESLHVRAEQEFAVPPLALPDPKQLPDLATLAQTEAMALFLQRTQAVKPDFQLTNANARAVVENCACLDGLPLAIELAAARIKLLSPQALLARLDQRLQMLTSGAQDAPARQRTLRNTVAWSYQLLDAQEQRLFRQLAIFSGGCTLEAVEAVGVILDPGTDGVSVLERAASLIDKSLLQQMEQEDGEPRYVMLETIREYGLEVLAANGEMEAARQAHATYYLRLSEEAEPELHGPQQAIWLERLEQEHDNLHAAMRWSVEQGEAGKSMEMALRLGGALHVFWCVCGHLSEGWDLLERALAESEGATASVREKALITAADVAHRFGDSNRAEVLAEESLALSQERGDSAGIAHSLYRLGRVCMTRSSYTAARSLIEKALTLFKAVGNEKRVADSLHNLALLDTIQGEYARASALFEESLAMRRKLGDKGGIAHGMRNEMRFRLKWLERTGCLGAFSVRKRYRQCS